MLPQTQDPSELYDIEVLLPVHPVGHWLDRMNAFRHFGLLGGEQLRVRLVLLCGTHQLDAALHDPQTWPDVKSVAIVNGVYDHPAAKIYDYYANIMPTQQLQARWYLRVDDDSLTDVRLLVEHLDATLDWRDTLHLAGMLNTGIGAEHQEIVRDLGADHFLRGAGHCQIYHECEASLTSHGAMTRVLDHELAREFLRRVALLPGGYGDICLSIAARLAGMPIAQVPFMTAHCELDDFATFHASGDGFFHIHYMSPDNPEMWGRYMEKRREVGLSFDKTALLSDGGEESGEEGDDEFSNAFASEEGAELVEAGESDVR